MDSPSKPATEGILGAVTGAFASVRSVVANFFDLVTTEARRAGLTLMWLIVMATVVALLIVTAWLAAMAALTLWAVSLDMTWASAIALVAAANLLVAVGLTFACISMSRNLLFPATRRQIRGSSPPSDGA